MPPAEAAVTQRWILVSLDHPTRVDLLVGAAGLSVLAHLEDLTARAGAAVSHLRRKYCF